MAYFSVITPTYNRAHFITKAIESVLNQTFSDWELIVVDDGSTDNTKEVVNGYTDDRIYYLFQSNAERSAARNNGINHSKGKYICFLDSDDIFTINRLEKLYDSIQKHNEPVAMFFTGIKFDNGSQIGYHSIPPKNEEESIYDFMMRATVATPRVCIHQNILVKHQFNPSFRIGEDTECWIRIAKEFPILYLTEQNTVIQTDHEERSVNLHKHNCALEELQMLRYVFQAPHPGERVSNGVKKESLSNCYFHFAKHYMFNNKKAKAVFWILKSMHKSPLHSQNKHRLFCLSNLVVGRIPEEYVSYFGGSQIE